MNLKLDRKQTWRCQLPGDSISSQLDNYLCSSVSEPLDGASYKMYPSSLLSALSEGDPLKPGSPLVTFESSAAPSVSELGWRLLLRIVPHWVWEPQVIICSSRAKRRSERERERDGEKTRNSETTVECLHCQTKGLAWEDGATTNSKNMNHRVLR